jgi:phenylacetate-CoA ligase
MNKEITVRENDHQPAALKSPDEKLRDYVREIPLYQSAAKAGDRSTWSELLTALPFITKQDIKKDFPKNFLREGHSLDELVAKKRVEIEHTAGTTDNRADLLLEYGWWARQEAWALSLNPNVAQVLSENPEARRVAISSPACNGDITYHGTPSRKRRTLGNTRVLSLSRFPFLLSPDDLDRMVEEALDWDPVFLDTDPVYAAVFALHCERRKVKFRSLKFITTSYEYTSVLHKRILERVFGVPVYNLYGSTETGHLMMEQSPGEMVPSTKAALLDVINEDDRGIGELVVSTLTNDYMPLLNYRIGDLVERRSSATDGRTTYILHGRAPDTLKAPDGRRITTRDIDQCFVGAEGLLHYRLHEISSGSFLLTFIEEGVRDTEIIIRAASQKLEQLIQPSKEIELKQVKFLLPEGSGKFVFNYPFVP